MPDFYLSKVKLVLVMNEFITNTICGHESGFYKMMLRGILSKDILSNKVIMMSLINQAAANYLNGAYVAFIKENDPYYLKYFYGMANCMQHSHICLLNIVMKYLTLVHNDIDRSKLDLSSYNSYMKCVEDMVNSKLKSMKKTLIDSISHKCIGEDIRKCDPNKKFFVLKNAEVLINVKRIV